MWALAEQNNPRAFDEFEAKYPHLVGELGSRIAMVRGIRGEGHAKSAPAPIPSFRPTDSASRTSRNPLVLGGIFALAGLAFGSFYATRLLASPAPEAPTHTVISYVPPVPPVTAPKEPVPQQNAPDAVPTAEHPDPAIQDVPAYLKPRSVKLEKTSLVSAIKLIAGSGDMQVEIAPGMPNPDVKLVYDNMSAVDILNDLGRQYAFTVFDEGNKRLLIVPVPDDSGTGPKAADPTAKAAEPGKQAFSATPHPSAR
jgi:hypothetical protein